MRVRRSSPVGIFDVVIAVKTTTRPHAPRTVVVASARRSQPPIFFGKFEIIYRTNATVGIVVVIDEDVARRVDMPRAIWIFRARRAYSRRNDLHRPTIYISI